MSTITISPLRQRMIEDMNARKLNPLTQKGHIRSCKRACLWSSAGCFLAACRAGR